MISTIHLAVMNDALGVPCVKLWVREDRNQNFVPQRAAVFHCDAQQRLPEVLLHALSGWLESHLEPF